MTLLLRNIAGFLFVLALFAILVGLPVYFFGLAGAVITAAALVAGYVALGRVKQ